MIKKQQAFFVLGVGALMLVIAIPMFDAFTATEPPTAEAVRWMTFDEGMKLAQQEKKKVLVDVFTDWCSWCKKMDKDVYTDATVRSVLEKNFVSIKLDAESQSLITFRGQSMTQESFARAAGANSYPSTLFLDESLRPINLMPGFVPAERFAKILSFVGEGHYTTTSFQDYLAKQPVRR